jgi:hypothetical protein
MNGKDMEGNDRRIMEILYRKIVWATEESREVRVVDVIAGI